MYKKLFFLVLGLAMGLVLGAFATNMMLSPHIGDEYTIKRPKIKGNDNILRIDQENLKTIDNNNQKFRTKWKNKRRNKK